MKRVVFVCLLAVMLTGCNQAGNGIDFSSKKNFIENMDLSDFNFFSGPDIVFTNEEESVNYINSSLEDKYNEQFVVVDESVKYTDESENDWNDYTEATAYSVQHPEYVFDVIAYGDGELRDSYSLYPFWEPAQKEVDDFCAKFDIIDYCVADLWRTPVSESDYRDIYPTYADYREKNNLGIYVYLKGPNPKENLEYYVNPLIEISRACILDQPYRPILRFKYIDTDGFPLSLWEQVETHYDISMLNPNEVLSILEDSLSSSLDSQERYDTKLAMGIQSDLRKSHVQPMLGPERISQNPIDDDITSKGPAYTNENDAITYIESALKIKYNEKFVVDTSTVKYEDSEGVPIVSAKAYNAEYPDYYFDVYSNGSGLLQDSYGNYKFYEEAQEEVDEFCKNYNFVKHCMPLLTSQTTSENLTTKYSSYEQYREDYPIKYIVEVKGKDPEKYPESYVDSILEMESDILNSKYQNEYLVVEYYSEPYEYEYNKEKTLIYEDTNADDVIIDEQENNVVTILWNESYSNQFPRKATSKEDALNTISYEVAYS